MMALPRRLAAFAATLLAAGLLSSGVRAQQPSDEADDDDDAPPAVQSEPAAGPPLQLPLQDLTGQTLYDFLLGEIAAQRGNPGLAAQTFLELAKRTRDPRVARRAVEVANLARMPALALESARMGVPFVSPCLVRAGAPARTHSVPPIYGDDPKVAAIGRG
jgi:hypothetical protein